ncbi:zinc carboxypeptidase [Lutibacter sp. Hel_I_33_5]|uniref:M14 family zinc carboxypeptidase n=1 Tax=Lutibacter sp. Hel_I_33_5 TaxID=1566289 RepID=UPI0011A8A843|nr:M14 family zinc carboxypeptidase [Lutibacter sp. Hel_I_33_5]TVZ54910.1 zinc carboxypeptidase [Lutibacter sp. Hel_I_33_5]
MNIIEHATLETLYSTIKEEKLFGRWIRIEDIEPLIKNHATHFSVVQIGFSEENRPIYKFSIGSGKKKILIWSQMHGNEATGTKAVFDLLNMLKNTEEAISSTILKECTLEIIPMLNPDGSERFTRVNANEVDLNRDAVALEAKESTLLRKTLDDFNPTYCFNLHDQRTIFGVENTDNPATISFLAPSEEESRALTSGRKLTMNVIVAMNALLQQVIPNHVGRYTDEFYPTATGDTFQKLGYNTILIEAGHYKNDYDREEVRKYNYYALLQGIYHIATASNFEEYEPYFEIPNNDKSFLDVIHRNPNLKDDIGYQYEYKIINSTLVSSLVKHQKGDLPGHKGHSEIVFES